MKREFRTSDRSVDDLLRTFGQRRHAERGPPNYAGQKSSHTGGEGRSRGGCWADVLFFVPSCGLRPNSVCRLVFKLVTALAKTE